MKAVTWSGFGCCGYTCLIESYNISKPKAPEESKNCEPSIALTSDMKLFDGLVTFPVPQVLATDTCICAILRVWLNRKRFTNGGEKIIKHNHKDSVPNKCRGNSRAMLAATPVHKRENYFFFSSDHQQLVVNIYSCLNFCRTILIQSIFVHFYRLLVTHFYPLRPIRDIYEQDSFGIAFGWIFLW